MSGEAEIRKKKIYRVTFIGFAVNLLLAGIKLAAGILGRSGAMVADAVHSFSDMATDVVVIAFAKISAKPKDEGHDYGHGKYETLATIIISLALAAVGTGILVNSIGAIRVVVDGGLLPRPGTVALLAAAVSIVVKEILYRYTVREGRRVSSPSMIANAWHHRSDALSSVGAFIGILGARMGVPVMDPLASFVICIFIVKAALDVFRDSMDKMVDKACDEETVRSIEQAALDTRGVERVGSMKTRLFGSRIYVDLEIEADKSLMLEQAFTIAKEVHDTIEARFPQVKHCSVQVSPEGSTGLEGKEN